MNWNLNVTLSLASPSPDLVLASAAFFHRDFPCAFPSAQSTHSFPLHPSDHSLRWSDPCGVCFRYIT